ncbi:cupin domain-containing protein [Bacteroidota bacterium]
MAFIDFNTRKRIQIWDGISGPVFHSDQATFGHFTLEAGSNLPSHTHPNEQWTNVIEGELEFNIEGEFKLMKAGMTAYIPSNVAHSAKAITKCKVIDCFMPTREDFMELEKET